MFYKEVNFIQDPVIGRIPKEWEAVRLKEVAEIRNNKTANSLEKIAFIPMELISESQIPALYQVRRKEDVRSSTYCEAGDLLLAKITPSLENGKQGIVPSDVPNGVALATTEVFPISCKGIDSFFLFHVLKFSKFRNKIISSMIGTTGRQRASKESVEKLTIPLPPIGEQKAIVGVFGVIDLAIDKTGEAIAKTERLKKGLMQELLTKGTGHKEYKQTPIGMMPKPWEIVKIGDVAVQVGSGLTPRGGALTYLEQGIPLIRSQNVQMNRLDLSDVAYISQETHRKEMARSIVLPNDLLLNITGASIGRVTVVPTSIAEANVNQHVCRIRFVKEILPAFASYYLSTPGGRRQVMSFQAGATRQGLNYQQARSILLPKPPLSEQQEIAEIMVTVDKRLELETNEKTKLERIRQGLMDLLLTGKIRVKVD